MKTTLKQLRAAGACYSGYNRLVRHLQGQAFTAEDRERKTYIRWAHHDEIPLLTIMDSNGVDDAFWSLRASDCSKRDARMLGVSCARMVQHPMTDPRSIAVLDVAERHANGAASDDELRAARDAAWDAARDAAWVAAQDAARDAAWDAAQDAAWVAAQDAARDAAWAAARDAAWVAARDEIRTRQEQLFRAMCTGNAPWQINNPKNS